MQNPYTLLCYILTCNQLLWCYFKKVFNILSRLISIWSQYRPKSPNKVILEPSFILYLQVTQPMSNMFLFYVF